MEKKAIGWRRLLTMLAIAGGLTLLAGLGVLDRADRTASDALCQRTDAFDGDIMVVGIDQRALEQIGP